MGRHSWRMDSDGRRQYRGAHLDLDKNSPLVFRVSPQSQARLRVLKVRVLFLVSRVADALHRGLETADDEEVHHGGAVWREGAKLGGGGRHQVRLGIVVLPSIVTTC